MERYKIKITGGPTSMIMHADDVTAADTLSKARGELKSKKLKSTAGDDRTPPWSWKTYLYTDGGHVVIPTQNLQTCIMKGGAEFSMPGSKKGKTLKSVAMTALRFDDAAWVLHLDGGGVVPSAKLDKIVSDDFEDHLAAAIKLGFVLDVRRVTIGQSKNVRVRPRFSAGWWIEGTVTNTQPDLINAKSLQAVLTYCGDMVGLGDWRPSAPKKPGPHGKFVAEVTTL